MAGRPGWGSGCKAKAQSPPSRFDALLRGVLERWDLSRSRGGEGRGPLGDLYRTGETFRSSSPERCPPSSAARLASLLPLSMRAPSMLSSAVAAGNCVAELAEEAEEELLVGVGTLWKLGGISRHCCCVGMLCGRGLRLDSSFRTGLVEGTPVSLRGGGRCRLSLRELRIPCQEGILVEIVVVDL